MNKRDSSFVRYATVSYLCGRGISTLLGPDPIVPPKALDVGKYSLSVDHQRYEGLDICGLDLEIIARGSLDHVFIGPRLATITNPEPLIVLLASKLKLGAHMVFHVEEKCPLDSIRAALRACGTWQEKDTYTHDGQHCGVWKLVGATTGTVRPPKPIHPKRALISRFGAIGDAILLTPLIRALAEDGYEVTLNVTPYGLDVYKHNPYVSNIRIQERDAIPNPELGPYWAWWAEKYQKYVNLSESIEGSILKVEGRRDFYTSRAWREEQVGKINYVDNTMKIGGYPNKVGLRGELYFNANERKAAKYVRDKLSDKFLILWGLKGSSYHKQYPYLRPVLEQWLSTHKDAHVMLTGAEGDRGLGFDSYQVQNMAGAVPLREVFALCKVADLVVGPESALINAAGCFYTPKIVFRSHSACANLCANFLNHTCLQARSVCTPCYGLHYSEPSCPLITIEDTLTQLPVWKGPRCCAEIPPEQVIQALDAAFAAWSAKRQP